MRLDRRAFLRTGAAAAAAGLVSRRAAAAAPTYAVGVGRGVSAYATTLRAIEACGEWPLLGLPGRTVVVKPNLVAALPASSGATTDPGVVRAVVDLALAGGAAEVLIVETSPHGAHFAECGYGFFDTYDPGERVRLVDLQDLTFTTAAVPGGGLAYPAVSVPDLLLGEDVVFVSVGKLKVHMETLATLATKNLFGLPAVDAYVSVPASGRFAMHDRGTSQTIVDLNRLRPVHFAVIDGIWGMEGAGPLLGTPAWAGTVIAGRNPVAVDRIGLAAIGLEQWKARHLTYAARFGLGPSDLSSISVSGDPLSPRTFALSALSPLIEYPRVTPAAFRPGLGQKTGALGWFAERCVRQVDVLKLSNDSPDTQTVRTLAPYDYRDPGYELLGWDGRDDAGGLVPPGRYAVHVRALSTRYQVRHSDGIGWVTVEP